MRSIDYSTLRGLKAGAIGGLVGAAVLGVLAGLSAFVLDQEVFYVTIATKLDLSSPVITGCALHFLVGLIAGGGVYCDYCLAQDVRPRHNPKEFLGRLVRRNRSLDSCLRPCGRPIRPYGPFEPDVCRRKFCFPSSLRSSDGARVSLAYPSKREDPANTISLRKMHGLSGGLGRI
jgi:hypothetical protein